MPSWLQDAVFYEIYPQSFKDSNDDGIGDINGITESLDYIKELGCNALWINPCFDSPFKDAGYDVRDYKKVAPRYGTNDDLVNLFNKAHEKGVHVLLDLVPGHTSEEHEWFKESKSADKTEYDGRYIWTTSWFEAADGFKYIAGEADRDGCYVINFFKSQPALNYGFGKITAHWQKPANDPESLRTRDAMKNVMRFWLDKGCDGFRVDMADSLVKNDDEEKSFTQALWRDVREMLDSDYPEAAMVSEWDNAGRSIGAGFHMDFTLNNWGTGYSHLLRDYINHGDYVTTAMTQGMGAVLKTDKTIIRKNANGNMMDFLGDYEKRLAEVAGRGYVSLITGNHDTPRINAMLSDRERKLAFAFILTLPGVPFIYYGDEIGMKYRFLPTKEGGYTRTGSRTPMQWNNGKNLGFSEADASELYLPVEEEQDAPTVESQKADKDSLFNTVKNILQIRHSRTDLQADGSFEVLKAEEGKSYIVFRRDNMIVGLNPSGEELNGNITAEDIDGQISSDPLGLKVLYTIGEVSYENGSLILGPQSFVILG